MNTKFNIFLHLLDNLSFGLTISKIYQEMKGKSPTMTQVKGSSFKLVRITKWLYWYPWNYSSYFRFLKMVNIKYIDLIPQKEIILYRPT